MKSNKKISPKSDTFTAILALATGIVIASSAFIAYMCFAYYESVFKIASPTGF